MSFFKPSAEARAALPRASLACAWALVALGGLGMIGSRTASTAAPADGQETKRYDEQVRAFLVKHCQECHGGAKPKGDFHLDRLAPNFVDKASQQRWLAVLEQ